MASIDIITADGRRLPAGSKATKGARYRVRYRTPDGLSRTKTYDRKVDAEKFATSTEHSKAVGEFVDSRAGREMFTEFAHFATFPMALPKRLIEAMCPLKVCNVCGVPSARIVEHDGTEPAPGAAETKDDVRLGAEVSGKRRLGSPKVVPTGLWTDCGHDDYRNGIVLDSFVGSGTTLEAAQAVGRSAIGIDIDRRNAELAQQRVGMFMTIDYGKDSA